MGRTGAKGYHDGREGRTPDPPNDLLDHIFSGWHRNSEMNDEDREYREGYEEGKKDRDK